MISVIQQKIIGAVPKFKPVCRYSRDVVHIIPKCLKPLPISNGCMMGAAFFFWYKYMQEIIGSAKEQHVIVVHLRITSGITRPMTESLFLIVCAASST